VHTFFDGTTAVTLFFVLSGFVLTFGHLNHPERPFRLIPFYARRFTRIWLPWFAIFVFSALAKELIPRGGTLSTPSTSEWLRSMWQGPTQIKDLLLQLVFQLHDAHRMLMCQDWSLGVELRAALFIPLLLFLAKWRWISLLVIGIVLPYIKESGFYYTPFCAGILVARWSAKTDQCRRPLLLVGFGLFLYQMRWFADATNMLPSLIHEREIWLVSTVGCSLILAGTLRSSICRNFLEHPFFLYLGRVSYSLYLIQMLILICLAPYVMNALNSMGFKSTWLLQFLVLVIVSAVCLILADICERFIEQPCIQLGRFITSRLNTLAFVRRLQF
jgi:peptidoglycan/LPS O-acetylase OafA/YrhL